MPQHKELPSIKILEKYFPHILFLILKLGRSQPHTPVYSISAQSKSSLIHEIGIELLITYSIALAHDTYFPNFQCKFAL